MLAAPIRVGLETAVGTPMRDEFAALCECAVATATEAATATVARGFGDGPLEAAHQAHIVEA